MVGIVIPTVREVTSTVSELRVVLLLESGANFMARNRYCIRVSVVAGTVGPTVRHVTCTASQLVLLLAEWCQQ